MKYFLATLTLMLLIPAAAPLLVYAKETLSSDKAIAEVKEVERQRVQSLLRNDLTSLERFLADDLTYTHSSGLVDNKEQFLASLRAGAVRYEMMEHEEVQARAYGETIVLTGRSKVKVKVRGEALNLALRFTLVYARQGGQWRMAAWQSTRVTTQ